MATYAVQHITKDGAFCGQQLITNRARAMLHVQNAVWVNVACVVITVTANNQLERMKLRATAVSQVFHERKRAMDWLEHLFKGENE